MNSALATKPASGARGALLRSCAAFLLGSLCLLAPEWAAAAVAEVLKVVGHASASDANGDIRTLADGSELEVGETIVTGPDSFLRMKLADDGYVVLRPNTRFQIEDFNLSEREEDNRSVFNLVKGGFRAVTGLVGKRNKPGIAYKTAVATIGIRGTDLEVADCTAGCEDGGKITKGLFFKVHSGTIAVNKREFPAGTGGFVPPDTRRPLLLKFDDPKSPLNKDPTPPADPDKCF